MEEREMINATELILEIDKKIKAFTLLSPPDEGIADTSYIHYLVSCSKLFELHFNLNSLQNEKDEMDYDDFVESLLDIEHKVDECTRWLT